MIRSLVVRLLLAVFGMLTLYQGWLFAEVWWYTSRNPSSSALMDERLAQLQQTSPDAHLQQRWVPYSQISPWLKRAVIASEDSTFVQNNGFDWQGIRYAAQKDLSKGRIVAGGSTITQQLAKNLFLSDRRTPGRKLEEAIITIMLEHMMSKRRILELYLNLIEWGNGIFGAEAAAQHYFHTSASQLSPTQAARLAAMIPDPRYFDHRRNARGMLRHAATIEARMTLVSAPR